MEQLYRQFLKEKEYLTGVSPRTIKYFRFTFNSWDKHVSEFPSKQNVKEWVIKLTESGIKAPSINSYIRGFNSFLTWLHENEHLPEPLRIKKVKEGERALKTFTDAQLKRLLSFRPKTFAEQRVYAMVCLGIDCGVRIDEIITLTRAKVDFDNLLVTVRGKGDKERIVPISQELRKTLYLFLKKHNFDLVFPTRHGDKISYRTALEQIKEMAAQVGINKASWHMLRHTFATCYVRDGGNVFYLSKILGHSDLQTTQIYVRSQTADLSLTHRKTSLLHKLK